MFEVTSQRISPSTSMGYFAINLPERTLTRSNSIESEISWLR